MNWYNIRNNICLDHTRRIMSADESNASNGDIPPKPSRPFTEYHIFCQLERNYILQTSDKSSHIDTTDQWGEVDQDGDTRPPRYRSVVLPKEWYTKGSRPKSRSQRKSHGKVTFIELTKILSKKWRDVDAVTKAYCRDLADKELKKYREVMKAYVELYGKETLLVVKNNVLRKKGVKKEGNRKEGGSLNLKDMGESNPVVPSFMEVKSVENQGDVASTHSIDQGMINSFLLKNQASLPIMNAAPTQASMTKTFLNNPALSNLASFAPPVSSTPVPPPSLAQQYPNLFAGAQKKPIQQTMEEISKQQAYLGYQSQLLQMRKSQLQLQTRMDRTLELMKMQQTQATQASMMPQMFSQEEPYGGYGIPSSFLNYGGNNNASTGRMLTMTTVKDQGQLPPLFEDQEFHDGVVDDYNINTAVLCGPMNQVKESQGMYSTEDLTQGSPKRGRFDTTNILGLSNSFDNPFNDCSIDGPMGNNPSSPSMTPLLTEGMANEDMALPPSPGSASTKSISPVPEYNIAPEISFLAKNFVNEFSRYLNHDHDVQQGDMYAFDAQATLDYQGVEKQALNKAFDGPSQYTTLFGGQQEPKEGSEDVDEINRTNNNELLTRAHMKYCMPLKTSKPPVNQGNVGLGPPKIPDVSKRKNIDIFTTAASTHGFSTPSNQLYQQQMFCTTAPPVVMHSGSVKKTKGPSQVAMSQDSSGDFQAWFSNVST